MSPGESWRATSAATASVASGPSVSRRSVPGTGKAAQADSAGQQEKPRAGGQRKLNAGSRQLSRQLTRAGRRGGIDRSTGGRSRRAIGRAGTRFATAAPAGDAIQRIDVLVVAGTLGHRRRRHGQGAAGKENGREPTQGHPHEG